MLFERFVFVLYVLAMYTWFLAGLAADSSYRVIPLILMFASLFSVIFITMLQLQTMLRQKRMFSGDKWSTVVWSFVHILLSGLFMLDTFEYTNVLVVLGLAGIMMTIVIFIVSTCACFVIIRDSLQWQAHLHLTCICFWVLTQYMTLRISTPNAHVVTSIPIICMCMLRLGEHIEHACSIQSCMEFFLWVLCIALHVAHEYGQVSSFVFFISCAVVIVTISLLTRYTGHLFLIAAMPLILLSLFVYAVYKRKDHHSWDETMNDIMTVYDDIMTGSTERLPLDEDDEEAFTVSL